MANLVTYGSFDFSTICGYDPFVGINDEAILVGGKFQTLKRVTIQGKILPTNPSCANENNNVTTKINQLILALKNDFQLLKAGDIQLNFAKCESIDIDQSSFFGGANFTATFSAYPSDLSEIGYYILDPVDSKQFSEGEDGTITISRQISVKGITANNKSALENAREFISNYYANQSYKRVPNIFLELGQLKGPGAGNVNLKPRRIVETINRMEGTISIDIDFVYRSTAPSNNTILSYSVDVGYDDKSGIYTATLNGNLVTSDTDNNSDSIRQNLKTDLNKLNFFNLTINIFRRLTGFNYLNPEPESFSVREDIENNTITFNYSYVSDPFPVKQSLSYDIQYDSVRDITTVSITGTLTARGPQKNRKTQLENALRGLNLYNLAQSFFTRYAVSKNPNLNRNPENYSITRNQFGSGSDNVVDSINVSATYSNQYLEESGLIKFEFNLSASPSIDVYLPVQFLDGSNGIFDMNFYRRGTISVNGSALGKTNNLAGTVRSLALSKLNSLASTVGASNRVRTQDNVTYPRESDDGYVYNFTIEDNCETRKYE